MTAETWHGTPGGSMRHWRAGEPVCDACQTAKRRTAKAATLDRERGNPRMVELGDAAHGIIAATPRDQLARATGLSVHKLCRMDAAGPDQNVHRRTRDRILEVRDVQFWTPIGIQRRLRALHALGWSMRALATEVNTANPTTLLNLVRRENPQFVRRDFAERIIDAYDRLRDTQRYGRGASRAKNIAAEKQWPGPRAWDNIDDPREEPYAANDPTYLDPVLVDRIAAGSVALLPEVPVNATARTEVCRRWHESGRSLAELSRLTGWRVDRYYRISEQEAAA